MSTKQELQNLHNRLDKCQRKLDAAKSRGDQEMVTKFTDDADKLSKKIHVMKSKQKYDMNNCLLYTSPSPRDGTKSRMPSSA